MIWRALRPSSLWQLGIHFLIHMLPFQFNITVMCDSMASHSNIIMINGNVRYCCVNINRHVIIKVSSIRIGNITPKCIPVTFVRVTACKSDELSHVFSSAFLSSLLRKLPLLQQSTMNQLTHGYMLSWLN